MFSRAPTSRAPTSRIPTTRNRKIPNFGKETLTKASSLAAIKSNNKTTEASKSIETIVESRVFEKENKGSDKLQNKGSLDYLNHLNSTLNSNNKLRSCLKSRKYNTAKKPKSVEFSPSVLEREEKIELEREEKIDIFHQPTPHKLSLQPTPHKVSLQPTPHKVSLQPTPHKVSLLPRKSLDEMDDGEVFDNANLDAILTSGNAKDLDKIHASENIQNDKIHVSENIQNAPAPLTKRVSIFGPPKRVIRKVHQQNNDNRTPLGPRNSTSTPTSSKLASTTKIARRLGMLLLESQSENPFE